MSNDAFVPILRILWERKKVILGSILFSVIITSAVMWLQPNYYKSICTFYPVNDALLDPSNDHADGGTKYYGDDYDVDRLLTMANSSYLKEALIQANDLSSHYNIDASAPKGKLKLFKKFQKLYGIQKTAYDALELWAEDKDPAKATEIVSKALALLDQQAMDVVVGAQKKVLEEVTRRNNANQLILQSISDSVKETRIKYGIYSLNEQAEALTAMEIANPNNPILRRKINNYNQGVTTMQNLESRQEVLHERIAEDMDLIQQLQVGLQSQASSLHVIQPPTDPLEKSRPHRSLYVLGMSVLTGGLAMLYILMRYQLSAEH